LEAFTNFGLAASTSILLCGGFAGPVAGLYPPLPGQTPKTIYVIHRGMHTGIIVRTSDIPEGLWPENKTYPDARYLEVGWGDSQGYRFHWTVPIVVRALFFSRGSVLLLHDFNRSVEDEYTGIAKEIIEVRLSWSGFDQLCRNIQETYCLNTNGLPTRLPSEYKEEDFYEAKGHYSIVKNCNNWTARALRSAGCPIRPRCSVLAGIVMVQVRRFGRVILPECARPRAQQRSKLDWTEKHR
jgi:uncharacterized protein (TIGR02117 family)